MTNEGNKLNTIAGVVTYSKEHMNDEYLAGCWAKFLLEDLSWKIWAAKKPSSKRAPSWPWMALDGPVSSQSDQCGWYTPIVTMVSRVVDCTGPFVPPSKATGGTLILEGRFESLPEQRYVVHSAQLVNRLFRTVAMTEL